MWWTPIAHYFCILQVKIWYIPEKGLEQSLTTAECQFPHKQRRVETVGFHPTADYLLHSTAAGSVNLWDLSVQKEAFSSNEHPDIIQSLSWKADGTLLTTSCKDKMVRILDPRSNVPITMCADSHQSIKDSRVVWLGDQQRILSTGFDAARLRQIIIRDLRNFNVAEKTLELDCSTGILMPLYDPDTNMLFLAGKGDTTIAYLEVTDKDPYLIEGLRHNGKWWMFVATEAIKRIPSQVNKRKVHVLCQNVHCAWWRVKWIASYSSHPIRSYRSCTRFHAKRTVIFTAICIPRPPATRPT